MKKSVKILLYAFVGTIIIIGASIATIVVLRSTHDVQQESTEPPKNTVEEARTLEESANTLLEDGDYNQAQKKFEEARDIYISTGDSAKSGSLDDTIEDLRHLNSTDPPEPKDAPPVGAN